MKMKVAFLTILILTACLPGRRDIDLLQDAATIHNEMVKDAQELKSKLINLKQDSLTTIPSDSIHVLLNLVEGWESELVEVPGNERHSHLGSHHDHTPLPVTAAEMLNIQKDLRSQLENITNRFSALNPQLP